MRSYHSSCELQDMDHLPRNVVLEIVRRLDQELLLRIIPLVSRTWRQQAAAVLVELVLKIDLAHPQVGQLAPWLKRYGPNLQALSLTMDYEPYRPHSNHESFSEAVAVSVKPLTNLCSLHMEAFQLPEQFVESIPTLAHITALGLPCCSLKPIPIEEIAKLTKLRRLHLHDNLGWDLPAKGNPFAKLQQLTYLNIASTSFSNNTIRFLRPLRSLKSLNIRSNQLSSPQLTALAPLTQLTYLALSLNDLWTDEDTEDAHAPPIFPRKYLPNLKHLALRDVDPVAACTPWLSGMTALTRLEAEDLWDMDLGPFLAAVGHLSHLQDLSLSRHEDRSGCGRHPRKELTTPAAYSSLASLSQLTSLVMDAQVPDGAWAATFSASASFPRLQLLRMHAGEGGHSNHLISRELPGLVQCCPSLAELTCTMEFYDQTSIAFLSCLSCLSELGQLTKLQLKAVGWPSGLRYGDAVPAPAVQLAAAFQPMEQLRDLDVDASGLCRRGYEFVTDDGAVAFAQTTQVTRLCLRSLYVKDELTACPVSMDKQQYE